MNKIITLAAILSLALVASMIITPTVIAMPRIKRLMDFYVATIEGGSPQTVDYSWAYDTASGEIIFNTMDTLVMFNESHTDQYVGNIASSWSIVNLGAGGLDSGIPISGLTFENPANQTGTAKYYYRYIFNLNTTLPIYFQTFPNGTQGYQLTAADVIYSFQRTLVQDRLSGPSWMLYEPLLDNPIGGDASAGGVADLTDPNQVYELGRLIEGAVTIGGNPNQIYFNLMFPGAYAPFMQILTQTWSSIESKKWIQNEVISQAGRPDWNGDIAAGGYTDWVNFHNPTVSPLDDPTPMEYGSGPFCLVPGTPDYVNNFWAMTRYIGYFRGWPAAGTGTSWPNYQGYVNIVEETWNFAWAAASQLYKNGDADFVAVPSASFIDELYQSSTPPFDPPNYPQNGMRCVHPLPELEADAVFFTFDVSRGTPYQPLCPANTFNPGAIPPDFFGNPTWGIHVRRGFAKAFDYAQFLAVAARNEGVTPASAIISGLPYYNSSIVGYSYDLTAAKAEFDQAVDKNGKKLVNVGATIDLYYNTGNLARKVGCQLLQAGLTAACSNFTIRIHDVDWSQYLTATVQQSMASFVIGHVADFPDPHDFVFSFYHTGGAFAIRQAYSNSTLDALIDKAIEAPDGPQRQNLYNQIAQAAIEDCPDFMILQPISRHFERDWVNGWYFNPAYPGYYYYSLWKWYYVTPALYNVTYTYSGLNQPNSTNLPADVTYDGGVDITDVATVAKAFMAKFGPPISPRWIQKGDINNDRIIDITDVAYCAKQFGKKATPTSQGKWTPQRLLVYITPAIQSIGASATWTFTSTVIGGTGPYTYAWYVNLTGSPASTLPFATTANCAFTSFGNAVFFLKLYVNDSGTNKGESPLAWVTSKPLTVAIDLSPTATVPGTLRETFHFSSTVDGGTINNTLEGGYHYQWYSNQTGSMIAVPGATYPRYDLKTTAADIGNVIEVYLRVTDSSNTGPIVVNSNSIFIPTVFSVSISPASATLNVTKSESQVFSSTVTDATLPVSYQWFDNTTGPYLPVSGETGSTYTFTPSTSGIYGVYLVATDSRSVSVQSGTSIVTAVFSVSIAPASATLSVVLGESQTFTSTVTGATTPYSYQWYDNVTGVFQPVAGAVSSTYTFTPSTSGVYGVYLVVTDSTPIAVQSNTATVTAVFASISPSTAWLASGQTLTFTSTIIGGTAPYTYEWYMNNTVITGETGSTYAFTSPGDGTYNFTLRVTDSALHTVNSNTAWVYTAPLATSIEPASTTLNVTLGESQTFTSTATGGTTPYSYQWYDNITGVFQPVTGAVSSTYTFTPSTSGVYGVYLVVTDSSVPAVSVQSATSIVTAVFSVSISPASATLNVTKSESQVFSSTVTDATLPVSYQWYDNTTGPYLPVSGETGSTYTFTPTTSGIYGVYLVATDSRSVSVQSATSIVTAVS